MEILKVSSNSKPKAIAGALSFAIQENKNVSLQAVGAGAVNQAIKAIAIARGYLAPFGINLVTYPEFKEIEIDSEEKTAIRFMVETR